MPVRVNILALFWLVNVSCGDVATNGHFQHDSLAAESAEDSNYQYYYIIGMCEGECRSSQECCEGLYGNKCTWSQDRCWFNNNAPAVAPTEESAEDRSYQYYYIIGMCEGECRSSQECCEGLYGDKCTWAQDRCWFNNNAPAVAPTEESAEDNNYQYYYIIGMCEGECRSSQECCEGLHGDKCTWAQGRCWFNNNAPAVAVAQESAEVGSIIA